MPKNYVGEPFNLSLISGIENFFMLKRVTSRFSVELFVSQYRITSWWNPSVLCFRIFLVAKKFMDERGVGVGSINVLHRNFFVSQCQKLS